MAEDINYTIQGEGKTAGVPSYFLNTDELSDDFKSTREWLEQLNFYDNVRKSAHLVFVGNRIFDYPTSDLIDYLKRGVKHLVVEVETDGMTIPPKDLTYKVNYWNISPKGFNSKSLIWFRNNPKSIFKFEIEEEDDWDVVFSKYIVPLNINHRKVFLMPKGDGNDYVENHTKVTSIALANGVRFSSRLQKLNRYVVED